MKRTQEHYKQALELRRNGRTFREIAEEFGISVERARQLVLRAERIASQPAHWLDGLSVKAKNLIASEGFKSKEQLAIAIEQGFFSSQIVSNLGVKTEEEICEWLGVPVEEPTSALDRFRYLNELHRDLQNELEMNGFFARILIEQAVDYVLSIVRKADEVDLPEPPNYGPAPKPPTAQELQEVYVNFWAKQRDKTNP